MPSHSVVRLNRYVIEVLMRDLVGHDQQPSAFLVYLFLHAKSEESSRRILISLRDIAEETGLSKSAVQTAIFTLRRRKLIQRQARSKGMTSSYEIFRPWRKCRRYGRQSARR